MEARRRRRESRDYTHGRRPVLDLVLAVRRLTPRKDGDALLVQRGDKLVEVLDNNPASVKVGLGPGEHVGLDFLEQLRDGLLDTREGEVALDLVVATDGKDIALLDVLGSDLETERNTLKGRRARSS